MIFAPIIYKEIKMDGISSISSLGSLDLDNINSDQIAEKIAAKIIDSRDKDGDSALTVEEAGIPKEIFSKIDPNNDGVISQDEMKTRAVELQNLICSTKDMFGAMNGLPTPDKIKEVLGGSFTRQAI
jgi:Ca2+-binding EF-hand superfamily protein